MSNNSSSKLGLLSSITHKIEAWLWRRGFHNPAIRALLRDQICFLLLSLMVGLIALPWTGLALHFALGVLVFVNVFAGIAKHLLSLNLNTYSSGLLMGVLFRTTLRLGITAILLYVVLIVYNASAVALACGVTASMAVALGTFAQQYLGHKQ